MTAKQLEAYFFYKLKMVASDMGDRTNLCDLLVKTKGGMLRSKRIMNLGSFLLYRRRAQPQGQALKFHDPDGEFGRCEEQIKEYALRTNPLEDDFADDSIIVYHKDYIERKETISTDSGLGAKILQFLAGQCGICNQVECTIFNPFYHRLTDEALHQLFVGYEEGIPPLWKPDIEKIRRGCDIKEENGVLEMWIVREKIWCDKLYLDGVRQISGNASAAVDENLNLGVNAGSRATASRQIVNLHHMGFKPFRLFYNSQGDLVKWRPDLGNTVASVRGEEEGDGESYHDQFKDFHLGDFFVEPPPAAEADPLNVSLQPVEIKFLEDSSGGASE